MIRAADHVDSLAQAISRARIENTCFSEGPGEVDDHALARAVLLHLRDAPDSDVLSAGGIEWSVGEPKSAGSMNERHEMAGRIWRKMFDRMLGRPAEPCPHEWGDTLDDDHQQTCQKCGATRGVAHGE